MTSPSYVKGITTHQHPPGIFPPKGLFPPKDYYRLPSKEATRK